MRAPSKSLLWRLGYGVCCLFYVAWVVHLSPNNFDMVHGEYRRIEARLQPERIEELALKELVDKCRKEAGRSNRHQHTSGDQVAADPCLSWPVAALEKRQKVVAERLVDERRGAVRKLLVFYLGFGIIFLILPPVILYLLLSLFIWFYRSIAGVK
jgi:hypothetical protein